MTTVEFLIKCGFKCLCDIEGEPTSLYHFTIEGQHYSFDSNIAYWRDMSTEYFFESVLPPLLGTPIHEHIIKITRGIFIDEIEL